MFPTIQRYIKGWNVSSKDMEQELRCVPQSCYYTGIMYRGMRCNKNSIYRVSFASWTTSYEVALLFAGTYGIVIKKYGNGVDVQKLKNLYHWNVGNKYEREIISNIEEFEII